MLKDQNRQMLKDSSGGSFEIMKRFCNLTEGCAPKVCLLRDKPISSYHVPIGAAIALQLERRMERIGRGRKKANTKSLLHVPTAPVDEPVLMLIPFNWM